MIEESHLLLDTHVALWFFENADVLSPSIKKRIEAAANNDSILVSAITVWEIALLDAKRRIKIDRPIEEYVKQIVEAPGVKLIPLSPEISCLSVGLSNFQKDPADRIIVATSLINKVPLVTRDRRIIEYPKMKNLVVPID